MNTFSYGVLLQSIESVVCTRVRNDGMFVYTYLLSYLPLRLC